MKAIAKTDSAKGGVSLFNFVQVSDRVAKTCHPSSRVGLDYFISGERKTLPDLSVERMNYNGGNNALAVTSSITRFIAAHGLHFINRLTEVL